MSAGRAVDSVAPQNVGSVILSLIFILALVVALALLARRLQGLKVFQPRNNGGLEMEAQLALGTRQRVAIIRAGGRRILVGVTADQIRLLDRLPDALTDDPNDFRSSLNRTSRTTEQGA